MQILSHRGYWKETKEKNQEVAFERSFSLGFGKENDISIVHLLSTETLPAFTQIYKQSHTFIWNKFTTYVPVNF